MLHMDGEGMGSSPSTLFEYDERDETDKGWENARLLAAPDSPSVEINPPLPTPQRLDTAYLDGLRGLAAFCVFIHHFICGFTRETERGFGEDGRYHFAGLPFIRVLWNGADAAVAVFFVLSGYVLSIGPLRKLKQRRTNEVHRGLAGALVRRPIRLYMPPLAISLIVALLLHIPGLLVHDQFSKAQPSIGTELYVWFWTCYYYFSIFQHHQPGGFPYDSPVWTLPIELKGSLLVYGVLAILSLGLGGSDHKVPLMIAIFLFGIATLLLQLGLSWSMADFLFGMVVSIADVWSLGTYIIPRGVDVSNLFDRIHLPPEVPRLLYKSLNVASVGAQRLIRRAAIATTRIIPRPLLDRLTPSSPPAERPKSSALTKVCFFTGWYLLSQPCLHGHPEIALNTPGWGWLTSMVPAAYYSTFYTRYWPTWGALLLVSSLLRFPLAQAFFRTRPLQYLGHISFMLYIIHFPYFRTLPERVVALLGGPTNQSIKGTVWDHTWTIPDIGPPGLSLRFLLTLAVILPVLLVLSDLATNHIDQPSIKLGRWVCARLGLENRRPPPKNEESSLPV